MTKAVSNTVHAHRTDAGYTQEELASLADVSRQTIIAIEKGHYTPSVSLALRLGRIFSVPVEKLFHL